MMPKQIYKLRVTCRACGGPLKQVLDLGNICLNDFVDSDKEPAAAPLTLVTCENCGMVQLRHTTDLDKLYRQYWYKSSLNKSMIHALQDIVDNIQTKLRLRSGDVVLDIGCNDGTLLSLYNVPGLYKIGFDPALNLKDEAEAVCNEFYNTYFGDPNEMEFLKLPKARVITAIAMFYDLEDPHTFIELVKQTLAHDGIFVVQFTDLLSMLKINAFDNICHEHIEYYSLLAVESLLSEHGLQIIDVSTNDVNGGSVRIYAAHWGVHSVNYDGLEKRIEEEYAYFKDPDCFVKFYERVMGIKEQVMAFLEEAQLLNKKVFALGASTKGNTLLQFFGISTDLITYAAEVNPDKFGKMTVGTNIPIISEEEALQLKPDYFLILPWHFKLNIIRKLKRAGYSGKVVVPMPQFEIVDV